MPVSSHHPLPKQHHYVPQLLLRRFADARGQLYFFDKRRGNQDVGRSSYKKLFREGHLYSRIASTGAKDPSLELAFSRFETEAENVLAKIIAAAEARRLPGLASFEKELVDRFHYFQYKRTPDLPHRLGLYEQFDETVKQLVAEYQERVRPLSADELSAVASPEFIARAKKNATVDAIDSIGQEVLDAIGERGLCVGIITRTSKSFVIGSSPVVKLTNPGRTHIADHSVEVWLPISPNVMIGPGLARGTEKLVPIDEPSHVRHINLAIFKQSSVVASASEALIKSLRAAR